MADNTTLNAGSGGDVIATDDIGGVKYQRVKVTYGADGAAADVFGGNPLPVAMASLPAFAATPGVTLPYALPASVSSGVAFDARLYTDVEFQFTSGTVSVTRSLDGTNYVAWPVVDGNGNVTATASTPGIYGVDGGGYVKFSATVTARGM